MSARSKSKASSHIVAVTEFNLDRDVKVYDVFESKKGKRKFRMVKLGSKQNPKQKAVAVKFTEGGWIPFEVEKSELSKKLQFTFGVPSEKEVKAVKERIENAFIDLAKKRRKEWWPKYNISDKEIEDGFNRIYKEGNEKEDGSGRWTGTVRTNVKEDGDGHAKCMIVGPDKKQNLDKLNIHNIHSKRWSAIVVELPLVYFAKKTEWGLSKYLGYAQVEQGSAGEEVNYLNMSLDEMNDEDEDEDQQEEDEMEEGEIVEEPAAKRLRS